jgi:hypothetical protein
MLFQKCKNVMQPILLQKCFVHFITYIENHAYLNPNDEIFNPINSHVAYC